MFKRISLSTVGGAEVTVMLGCVMSAMIAAEYKAEDKLPDIEFDIHPVVDEPIIQPKIKAPDELPVVDPLPPLPEIEKATSDLPSESVSKSAWVAPDFNRVKLTTLKPIVNVANSGPKPIIRHWPVMPSRATKSGHCDVRFNINSSGKPYDIRAISCTQSLFRSASIKSVQKWNYRPEMRNGKAVSHKGIQTKIRFLLKDENNQIIPE